MERLSSKSLIDPPGFCVGTVIYTGILVYLPTNTYHADTLLESEAIR